MIRCTLTAIIALTVPAALHGQSWKTLTLSRQLEGNEEVQVAVDYGAGSVSVRSVEGSLLYRMNLRYDEDRFEPVADYAGRRLRLGVDAIGRSISIGRARTGTLELELARGVPFDLELKFGAVRADIDLGGLSMTGLSLKTGASESTINVSEPNPLEMETAYVEAGATEFRMVGLGNLNAERIEIDAGVGAITLGLDGRWRRNTRLVIAMGVGSLELRVPEGLGVQLRKDGFLTALDSEGLIKRGDVYESPDFEEAARRVVIDLDAAFGSVSVVWTRSEMEET
jgi:hypothetical protein